MSAQLENNSGATPRRRPQPIWPWLLMPLATLAVYFVLHSARQAPARTAPQTTAPGEAAKAPSPDVESH